MASLLPEFAGKINFIYIDSPFCHRSGLFHRHKAWRSARTKEAKGRGKGVRLSRGQVSGYSRLKFKKSEDFQREVLDV